MQKRKVCSQKRVIVCCAALVSSNPYVFVITIPFRCRGDWKRETWLRETIKIVGTDIARLDNAAPYRKGGHREMCFSVRVDAHYKFMFDSGRIIWAAHRFYVCSSISFCFTYCYVRQTKLVSSMHNVRVHYKIVIDFVKPACGATMHTLQNSCPR